MTDSQLGQLLYYLLAVQLNRLQKHLSPMRRHVNSPTPILGLFMDEGVVGTYDLVYTGQAGASPLLDGCLHTMHNIQCCIYTSHMHC